MKKFLWSVFYLAIPIIGWWALARSFKSVGPGEISTLQDLDGNIELIEEGLYFEPSPGMSFGAIFKKEHDFIDFGALKRVRVREGQLGVKTNQQGNYEILKPGVHIINTRKNETFNKDTGIQNTNSDDYTLGNKRFITIRNGELGEAYKNGIFTLLEPGLHELNSEFRFVKKASVASDVVDLGAYKLITVKEGQVAFVNTRNGVQALGVGKHEIKQEEGQFFDRIITTGAQGVKLPDLTVMCSDQIEMKAKSMLIYSVTEPLKTVALGLDKIVVVLKDVAEATLRSILSRFTSFDIAPTLHTDTNHESTERAAKLQNIHDSLVEELNKKTAAWGIEVRDLQITEILPADEVYHNNIRKMGTQQSTALISQMTAETNAKIAGINATAEQSKVTAAKIEQEEALVRAETEAKTKEINAKGDAQAEIERARGAAEATGITSQAQAERIKILNEATNGSNETTQMMLQTEAFGNVLAHVKNPVFVQPGLGVTNFYSKENDNISFFSSHGQGRQEPLVSALSCQAVQQALSSNH
jgi:regulator of protease activity HflC (stomatin/prohibitin superfamily)